MIWRKRNGPRSNQESFSTCSLEGTCRGVSATVFLEQYFLLFYYRWLSQGSLGASNNLPLTVLPGPTSPINLFVLCIRATVSCVPSDPATEDELSSPGIGTQWPLQSQGCFLGPTSMYPRSKSPQDSLCSHIILPWHPP